MENLQSQPEFSKLRQIFWPIHRHELKKFIPMVIMMFCFLFNYTIMRDTKDTLIVTKAGAEAIPFLKFWGVLPMSILFVLAYAKLANVLKPTTLFYSIVTPFMVFFGLFGFVLYPNLELVTPYKLALSLSNAAHAHLPAQMLSTAKQLIEVFKVWPYALFYVMSELWGSMGISLLFWQFANQITGSSEAKRYYPCIGQLGNIALICSGLTIIYYSNASTRLPIGADAWGHALHGLMGAITVGCAIIIATYYWMDKNVVNDPVLCPNQVKDPSVKKAAKPKLGLLESFNMLVRSKYLGNIAMLVIGYGISINIIEVVWKAQLKLQFPIPNDYNAFMGYFSMFTGITTFFLVIIGSNVIRKFGWLTAALAAPVMIFVTGAIFFTFVINKNLMAEYFAYSPLWIAVMVGAIQNIMSKSTKYSLFDPTKEMAYIPLDAESKIKGKAAIDVVGARLGKSGGGLVLQALLVFGSIEQNLPILFIFVAAVVVTWLRSVFSLSKMYHNLVGETVNTKESIIIQKVDNTSTISPDQKIS